MLPATHLKVHLANIPAIHLRLFASLFAGWCFPRPLNEQENLSVGIYAQVLSMYTIAKDGNNYGHRFKPSCFWVTFQKKKT